MPKASKGKSKDANEPGIEVHTNLTEKNQSEKTDGNARVLLVVDRFSNWPPEKKAHWNFKTKTVL